VKRIKALLQRIAQLGYPQQIRRSAETPDEIPW